MFPPNGDALPIEDAPESESLFVGDEANWLVPAVDFVVVAAERVVELAADPTRFFLGAKPIRRLSRSNTE